MFGPFVVLRQYSFGSHGLSSSCALQFLDTFLAALRTRGDDSGKILCFDVTRNTFHPVKAPKESVGSHLLTSLKEPTELRKNSLAMGQKGWNTRHKWMNGWKRHPGPGTGKGPSSLPSLDGPLNRNLLVFNQTKFL